MSDCSAMLAASLKDLLEGLELAEKHDDLPLSFVGYGYAFIEQAREVLYRYEHDAGTGRERLI